MSERPRLDVYLHGRHAGVITKTTTGLVLDYEREYVDAYPDYPLSYSLPMTTRRHKGARVANYLDNLMPDNGEVIARVHAEDMCQMLGLSSLRKYEHQGGPGVTDIFKALDLLPAGNRAAAKERFALALAFNWVAGGTDAHAKNYSVYVGPGGALAPLYDLSSFAPYTAPFFGKAREPMAGMKMPMRLSGNERFGDVDQLHWRSIARDARIAPRTLIDTIGTIATYLPGAWAREIALVAQADDALLTPVVLTSADALAGWCDKILSVLDP